MTAPSAVPVAVPTEAEAVRDDRAADVYCLGCGYNLRGLEGEGTAAGRCPECGRPFDVQEYAGVRSPWVQRHRSGPFVAYWHTALLVTFRPLDFARRFHWPHVRYHGSAQFRRLTVASATAAALLSAAALACHLRVTPAGLLIILGAMAPSAALFFYGATELGGFFVGPRLPTDTSEEGFRARIVNDYASAALAWLPVPALVVCLAAAAERLIPGPASQWLFAAAAALAGWLMVLWATDVLVLFGSALALGRGSLVLAGVFFPIRFAGVAVLTVLFVFGPLACAVGGLVSKLR
jgi:hypothetical protein